MRLIQMVCIQGDWGVAWDMETVFGALDLPQDAEEIIAQYMGAGPDGHPVTDLLDERTALTMGNDFVLARRDRGQD